MDQKKLSKKAQLGLISFFMFTVLLSIISIPIFSSFLPKSGQIEGVSTAQCVVNPLGIAQDYNMFVLNDMTESAVDTQGRVAVGGNATYLNYAVGAKLSNSNGKRDDLIVGKFLNFTNGSVLNGNIVYGDNFKLDKVSIPHGLTKKGNSINFITAATDLKYRSNLLSTLKVNGTKTSGTKSLTLVGTDNQFNVFNITAVELAPNITFTINAPSTSTVLINVNGTSTQFRYLGFNLKGVNKQNILYNFYNATKLQIDSIGIQGSVLAPNADVQFDNGNIDGTMIVNSLKGTGEGHNIPFTGCILNAITNTTTTAATTNLPVTTTVSTSIPATTSLTSTTIPAGTIIATSTPVKATASATPTTVQQTITKTTIPLITAQTIQPTTTISTTATTTLTTTLVTNTITTTTPTNVLGVSTVLTTTTLTPHQQVLAATTQITNLPNTGTSENVMIIFVLGIGLIIVAGIVSFAKPKGKN